MPANKTIPYLSEETLAGLNISTSDVVESIEALILGCEQGFVWSAPKAVILPDDGRYMMAALAAADEPPFLAVKTLVLNPKNPEKNLPQINGLVTILDSDTGLPVAILDGNWITAVRTAGLSAVAAKHMAREDSAIASFRMRRTSQEPFDGFCRYVSFGRNPRVRAGSGQYRWLL